MNHLTSLLPSTLYSTHSTRSRLPNWNPRVFGGIIEAHQNSLNTPLVHSKTRTISQSSTSARIARLHSNTSSSSQSFATPGRIDHPISHAWQYPKRPPPTKTHLCMCWLGRPFVSTKCPSLPTLNPIKPTWLPRLAQYTNPWTVLYLGLHRQQNSKNIRVNQYHHRRNHTLPNSELYKRPSSNVTSRIANVLSAPKVCKTRTHKDRELVLPK